MSEQPFSLDPIYDDRTVIKQHRRGYRFSVDALLLAWFVFRHTATRRIVRSLELGAGSGVISILLKRRGLTGHIDCVEREGSLFGLLQNNLHTNGFADDISPLNEDLRSLRLPPERYECVFFNPPYHPPATGRTSPENEKAAARHEIHGSLDDFLRVGVAAIKKNGRLFFIHPAERAPYAFAVAAARGLTPFETIAVREHPSDDPSLFLYGCTRGPAEKGRQRFGIITMRDEQGVLSGEGTAILYAPGRGTQNIGQ